VHNRAQRFKDMAVNAATGEDRAVGESGQIAGRIVHAAESRTAFVMPGATDGIAGRNSDAVHLDAVRAQTQGDGLFPLANVARGAWQTLAESALEPNAYYLPDWARAVDAFARDRAGAEALAVWSEQPVRRLIGVMPVVSFRRIYGVPLPALVSFEAYGTLGTPLIDRDAADEAAGRLLEQAAELGAHAVLVRAITLDGPVAAAFTRVLAWRGQRPRLLNVHARACLDATRDADALLQDALGAKKMKELRRQRNRLAETGAVSFAVARTPEAVAQALPTFLALESSGWKGAHGTALADHPGDKRFISEATVALAAQGQCEIVTLSAGDAAIAAGLVPRHLGRAMYFKIGIDERFAKYSPGVQLTLDLTRHLCADPTITSADSTAIPNHPMIDPIWRGRLAIGDMLIPLRRSPLVPVMQALLSGRALARNTLRPVVQRLRHLRGQFT
jgi:CelD/BcsL family acetyltransferase involved in cellulose biosynthesis